MEDQASSPSYDLAPTLSPICRQQFLSVSQSSCVSPVELKDRRVGEGAGGEAKS